jgi:hypothetical protein
MVMAARTVVLLFAALCSACVRFGTIDDQAILPIPVVSDGHGGHSAAFPLVLRIPVGPHERGPMAEVGRVAYDALFADAAYPPFVFNVTFASAAPDSSGRSAYSDPRSIWFNVFFGCYEVDVSQTAWERPFGYRSTDQGAEVAFEDIARIGKADWNYFSNHVYGVPRDAIRPHDVVDMGSMRATYLGRERIGERYWDAVELRDIVVASACQSSKDAVRLEETFPGLTPLWQSSFGTKAPDDAVARSFVPMKIRARIYMAYSESYDALRGEPNYNTYFVGATVNQDYPNEVENERFLGLQLTALRSVILEHMQDQGFATPR